jgi:hypothetical protein
VGGKKAEAQEQRRLIEQADALEVVLVPLRERVDEYADLAANHQTGVVLLSASLWKKSGHAYGSADVASFLRTLRPALPIFLLSDDEEDDHSAFDGVIGLKDLRRRPHVYASRLQRAAGRYRDDLDERQRRLQALLDRQVDEALPPDEADELDDLRAFAERPAQVNVAKQARRLELELAEKRNLVRRLEALAERLEGSDQ